MLPLVLEQTPEIFECFNCGRRFRWKAEIAGQTVRCVCGVKVRCPGGLDETQTAGESLEDTVADVELEESFDTIEAAEPGAVAETDLTDEGPRVAAPLPRRKNRFGLGPAGETLAWGLGALVCLSSSIIAVVGPPDWVYIVVAALTFWCAIQFYRSWKRWTRGRPWLECLSDLFEES